MLEDTGKATISFYQDDAGHIEQSIDVVDIYANEKLFDLSLIHI